MKLLHSEVDIVPGRPGMRPPVWPIPESQPIPGSAVVRLTNTSSRINACTVRIRCEDPFWQENWCAVIGLPPSPEKPENAPPAGKPDQRGPHDHWVKVHLGSGGTRDVLLRFSVPESPEARAGRYRYTVEVETQIIGAPVSGMRSERVTKLQASAVIRPYYKWTVDMSPEQPRVGIRRRSVDFEVVVTNEGNDWLYCDLQMPRPKDMLIEAPTLRLAVPPPEPGELLATKPGEELRPGVQRTVPLTARTHLRMIRGEITPQSILMNAERVDAPSVAPPAADPSYTGWGAVVAQDTNETMRLPGDRALNYCPPIPAKLTDFFTQGTGALRNLMFTIIGFVVGIGLLVVLSEQIFHNNIKLEPLSREVKPGGKVIVVGNWVAGSKVMLGGEDVKLKLVPTADLTHWQFTVPPDLKDGKRVKLSVQRVVGWIPLLSPLLPHWTDDQDIQVGEPPQVVAKTDAFLVMPNRVFMPGDMLEMKGGGLSPQGKVYVGGEPSTPAKWTDDTIDIAIPRSASPGPLSVAVYTQDNKPILASGTVNIGDPHALLTPAGIPVAPVAAPSMNTAAAAGAQAASQNAAQATAAATVAQQQAQQNPNDPRLAALSAQRAAAAAAAARHAQEAKQAAALQATRAAEAARARDQAAKTQAAANTAARARTAAVVQPIPPTPTPATAQPANGQQSKDLMRQGYRLSSQGQYPEAVKALQQAIQLDPTNTQAVDGLVITLNNEAVQASSNKQFEQSIALHSQALKVKPGDVDTMQSLARTHLNYGTYLYNNRQIKQAKDQWTKAIQSAPPGDPDAQTAQDDLNQTH